MDGRLLTVLLLIVLPVALLVLTIVEFGSNPISVFVLIGVMLVGGFYLLSYNESFA